MTPDCAKRLGSRDTWGVQSTFVLVALTGCGRLGYGVLERDAGPSASDGAVMRDADARDASMGDAAMLDAAMQISCPAPDSDTLALFSFDGVSGMTTLTDGTGNHDGVIDGGAASSLPGSSPCGEALLATAGVAGQILDAPAWQLEDGSVDFWVRRPTSPAAFAGLLTRDATGSRAGHFGVFVGASGRAAVRVQTGAGTGFVCTEAALPTEEWVHLGINFGAAGLELWLNGERMMGTGSMIGPNEVTLNCNSGVAGGIAGNNNRWVVGASNASLGEESAGHTDHFENGALDHVRISRVRRDFTPYAP